MFSVRDRVLADFDGDRRNNFTAIRILLAWSVLYGHGFAMSVDHQGADPLRHLFQGSTWIGEVAVGGFFALSGFLVSGSFVRRGLLDYALSRALRVLPALALCVAVCVFVLGPLMTTLPLAEYLASEKTWRYLANALAYPRQAFLLPGVFTDHPRPGVNGSLWTISLEVRCYTLLALLGVLGAWNSRAVGLFVATALGLFALDYFLALPFVGEVARWRGPAAFFLVGVFIYWLRDWVLLSRRLGLLAGLSIYFSFGQPWFDAVFPVLFAYLLFVLAYRTPYLDVDGKVGDISYGMYVYAWPVQQLWLSADMGMSPWLHTLLATATVTPLAWLSWHYIERPALTLKSATHRQLSKARLPGMGRRD